MRKIPFTPWVVLREADYAVLRAKPGRIRQRLHLYGTSPRVAREVLAAEMGLTGPKALERLGDEHQMIRGMNRALGRFIEIVEGRG